MSLVQLVPHIVKGDLVAQLEKKEQGARRALQSTMNDLKKRAPAKVSAAVVKRYAIKKGDIPKPGAGNGGGASSASASGEDVGSFALTYTGRLMTPLHFRMSPSARPAGGRKYTIKATILKGSRTTIGHGGRPGSEGGAYARPNDSPYILAAGNGGVTLPFQRKGDRLAKVFRTVSVPQMVGHDEVAAEAIDGIRGIAESRLNHYLSRYLGNS